MVDDIFQSVEDSIKKNISDFHKEQEQKRKASLAEKARNAEKYFFALKVKQPATVKSIFRIKPDADLEKNLVEQFVKFPLADPTRYTVVIEGKPFVALVSMDNDLQYRAAMTRLMYIEWPKGSEQNTQLFKQKLLGNNPERPVVCADKIDYALFLWPIHKDGRVNEHDSIDVRWDVHDDIATLQEKEGKDSGNGITTVGGVHLSGTGVCSGSFELLNDAYGMREKYPRHFHQMFSEIQKAYDRAREQKTLGKTIYSLIDPAKPPRGVGWTIPIFPNEARCYFEIPEIKIVNPNQPLQIIHKKPTPKRLTIHKSSRALERINTYE